MLKRAWYVQKRPSKFGPKAPTFRVECFLKLPHRPKGRMLRVAR